MIILSAVYETEEETMVRVDDDGTPRSVPAEDPRNMDCKTLTAWVADGNTIDPYVPPAEPEPTALEKLEAATGLTKEEIKEVLA